MIEVVEPATAEVMATVPAAGVEETDAAVARARASSKRSRSGKTAVVRSSGSAP